MARDWKDGPRKRLKLEKNVKKNDHFSGTAIVRLSIQKHNVKRGNSVCLRRGKIRYETQCARHTWKPNKSK